MQFDFTAYGLIIRLVDKLLLTGHPYIV